MGGGQAGGSREDFACGRKVEKGSVCGGGDGEREEVEVYIVVRAALPPSSSPKNWCEKPAGRNKALPAPLKAKLLSPRRGWLRGFPSLGAGGGRKRCT